jgi:hypothetical protein
MWKLTGTFFLTRDRNMTPSIDRPVRVRALLLSLIAACSINVSCSMKVDGSKTETAPILDINHSSAVTIVVDEPPDLTQNKFQAFQILLGNTILKGIPRADGSVALLMFDRFTVTPEDILGLKVASSTMPASRRSVRLEGVGVVAGLYSLGFYLGQFDDVLVLASESEDATTRSEGRKLYSAIRDSNRTYFMCRLLPDRLFTGFLVLEPTARARLDSAFGGF